MGFQSQAGQVGFKTQAAAGTYDDPGTEGVFMRLRSGEGDAPATATVWAVAPDGSILLGMQVQAHSGDLSADVAKALRWAQESHC